MLYLQQPIVTPMKSVAERTTNECCGFLFGSEEHGQRVVSSIMAVENTALDKRTTFRISSNDYLKAEDYASYHNLQLVGIYHSHPNHPAIPSEYDRVAAQPYFSYIILSVINKKVEAIRSWKLNGKFQFEEEPLSILNFSQHIYGYRNHPYPAA